MWAALPPSQLRSVHRVSVGYAWLLCAFLILLDAIAELGIHEWFFSVHAAFLTVFHPEEFFVDSVP